MVVVEVVAMPLGRIQAAARLSDDLQHSQHFLGRSLDHQISLVAAWIEGRFAAHDDARLMRKLVLRFSVYFFFLMFSVYFFSLIFSIYLLVSACSWSPSSSAMQQRAGERPLAQQLTSTHI